MVMLFTRYKIDWRGLCRCLGWIWELIGLEGTNMVMICQESNEVEKKISLEQS